MTEICFKFDRNIFPKSSFVASEMFFFLQILAENVFKVFSKSNFVAALMTFFYDLL